MSDNHFINKAEASLNSALYEKLLTAYKLVDSVLTIEFNPFGDEDDDLSFKEAHKPLESLIIFQSETPSLFVNLEKGENPPESKVLSISFFIYTVRETDGEEIGETVHDIEAKNDLIPISKLSEKYGFNRKMGPLDLVEGIIYYRQAMILEKRVRECGLFKLGEKFHIRAAVHGILDTFDETLWAFCERRRAKSVSTVFEELGFVL